MKASGLLARSKVQLLFGELRFFCEPPASFLNYQYIFQLTHLSGKDGRFSKMYFSSTFPLSSLTVLFQTKLSSRSSLLRISSTKYCPKKERYLNEKNREIHAHSCIMGNQGKMAGNSKICIGIQSHSRFSVLFF